MIRSVKTKSRALKTSVQALPKAHSLMVRALRKSPNAILMNLTVHQVDLWHAGTGVSGEAGELLDAIKKCCIYAQPLDVENVIEELGDLEFYMEHVRQNLNITRAECLKANLLKLAKRYGTQYSDQAAKRRLDKQTRS